MRMTLDGVMKAPGRPDENRRGGFGHGGWGTLWDPGIGNVAEERMGDNEALLFGRRTYEDFYSYGNGCGWALRRQRDPVAAAVRRSRSRLGRDVAQRADLATLLDRA